MLRRLVGTTAPDIGLFNSGMKKLSNHGSIPITIDCNVVAFIVFEEVRTNDSTGHKEKRPKQSFSGCNGCFDIHGISLTQMQAVLFVDS
ncbi:hypothetical protein TNCV_4790761 [Trichonephila clavipes]|nr:hypothetical protein TNCV_4790761 [Trichonephila clavipes]